MAAREAELKALSNREQQAEEARLHMRKQQMSFAEADADGNNELDFEEFIKVLPPHTTKWHSRREIREWFKLADLDGNGVLSLQEFFLWSLNFAARKSGSGIEGVFRRYDQDGSGKLDAMEFTQAVEDMGYGDFAHTLFKQLPQNPDRTISYANIDDDLESLVKTKEMKNFFLAMAWDGERKLDVVIDDKHPLGGSSPEEVRRSLHELLEREPSLKLSDIFREMDDDQSGVVSKEEFTRAFEDELHFSGPSELLTQIFDELDGDASGMVGFHELQAWMRGKKTHAAIQREKMRGISLASRVLEEDEAWDEARLHRELKAALEAGGLLATDVVRAWAGGDNALSKKEFLKSMKALINDEKQWDFVVKDAAVDAFDTIDTADDGSVGVVELCRWLEVGPTGIAGRGPPSRRPP